ncbi:uncharacterized protein AMSG_03395 [Thecamonas trahens ATCC 50062]|uniref:NOD3 protein n=1 Tax=Thecamonas trahens ATCC 50062 TaxID=461836 RepID=A0A0L0D3P8_THETB|nr:hypothetical protein AMSG_03395 [Thecamonas trahens ATCC 50062]KNC46962.1 hypothetical protein AMSG_03395 [Thecamonas trahens ATCC 50062]|eukprot:XP_013760233.1 hypothetical protein AMSG_03395 [Thecamonas trahens ATCC 50062]
MPHRVVLFKRGHVTVKANALCDSYVFNELIKVLDAGGPDESRPESGSEAQQSPGPHEVHAVGSPGSGGSVGSAGSAGLSPHALADSEQLAASHHGRLESIPGSIGLVQGLSASSSSSLGRETAPPRRVDWLGKGSTESGESGKSDEGTDVDDDVGSTATIKSVKSSRSTKSLRSRRIAKKVKSIDVSWQGLDREKTRTLCATLSLLPRLEAVVFSHNRLKAQGMVYVARMLVNAPLTRLSLCDVSLDVDGLAVLSRGIRGCPTLRVLDVSHNPLGSAVTEGSLDLSQIDLDEQAQTSANLSKYAGRIFAAVQLDELRLVACNFGDSDVHALLAAMVDVPGGEVFPAHIDLAKNAITDSSASQIAFVLAHPKSTISSICLDYNHLGPGGASVIAAALPAATSLTVLGIADNELFDDGVAAIAQTLARAPALEELNIAANFVSDDAMGAVARAVVLNARIARVDLSGNDVTDAGVHELICLLELFPTRPPLELAVDNNSVTPETAQQLTDAIARIADNDRFDSTFSVPQAVLDAAFVSHPVSTHDPLTLLQAQDTRMATAAGRLLAGPHHSSLTIERARTADVLADLESKFPGVTDAFYTVYAQMQAAALGPKGSAIPAWWSDSAHELPVARPASTDEQPPQLGVAEPAGQGQKPVENKSNERESQSAQASSRFPVSLRDVAYASSSGLVTGSASPTNSRGTTGGASLASLPSSQLSGSGLGSGMHVADSGLPLCRVNSSGVRIKSIARQDEVHRSSSSTAFHFYS